ncbi:MAG: hypothetical protein ACOXZH_04570 [Bacteroidales bacterium]|jgi:hypothetical protein|nr:hypothetical protein [Bacteroidales bacterium]
MLISAFFNNKLFYPIGLFLCVNLVYAQSHSNFQKKSFLLSSDTLTIDSLSLIPNSFTVEGVNASDYEVNEIKGILIVKNQTLIGKTITCTYRTYPHSLHQAIKHKDVSMIEKNLYEPINPLMIADKTDDKYLELSDAYLMSSGSLSRRIMLGNNQDMALQSNLNLQLSGYLSENLSILANITDKNIPIQPEGNTRQIQEFDKIFIQMKYKEKVSLWAGDIENNSEGTHFMRFTKKGQGLMSDMNFKATTKKNDTINYRVKALGAIAKGTFRRQHIVAIEGNQGPYLLSGENNENFIIILSGSERIYIDGKLLTRGDDADYVINYNSGELTFTANQLITKDKRIVAEFEYSDLNYIRGLTHVSAFMQKKKLDVSFHFYHEQDFKNQSNQFNMTEEHKVFLQSIGNRIEQAYFPAIDSAAFHTEEVMYKKIDTLVNGIYYDSVFVYSTDKDSACFRLRFSYVGEGNGNYVLSQSAANGKVYTWVAPIGNRRQGDYEAVILLITPKRVQMYSMVVNYELPKNTFIHLETSLSNNDINTFSSIGNSQNVGLGITFSLSNTSDLKSKKKKEAKWQMHSSLYYESKNKFFDYIENYRDVEFLRNFNLSQSLSENEEHYVGAKMLFKHKNHGSVGWTSNFFLIPTNEWKGLQHHLLLNMRVKSYKMLLDASLLQTQSKENQTVFIKHKEVVSKEFRYIEVGLKEEMEFNQFKEQTTHQLLPLSHAFNEAGVFLKNNDSTAAAFAYHLHYSNRIDKSVFNQSMNIASIAHEASIGFDFLKNASQPLRLNFTYRNISYKDSLSLTQAPVNTVLANIDYGKRFLKNTIQTSIFYEIGSGLEQKHNYNYIKVADGQGVYEWIDYNKNGIEELDEFEIAVFKDKANYIRMWLISKDYIKTYNNSMTLNLLLNPAAAWSKADGFKKFIARFSNSTTFQTKLKQTSSRFSQIVNPIYINTVDTALVNNLMHFRNAFLFNQNSTVWGVDAIYSNNKNKMLTVNGFEFSNKEEWQLTARWQFVKDFIFTFNYYESFYLRNFDFFNSRNFRIKGRIYEPIITYQFQNKLTVKLLYSYSQKNNRLNIERSYINKVSTEINYRMPKKGSFYTQISYYHIVFKGETMGSIAYEMLDALQPGHNGVFTLMYNTNLFQNLQLNLTYEGRISPKVKMIHTGGIEVRMFF